MRVIMGITAPTAEEPIRVPIHVWSNDTYEEALVQAKALASLPFIHNRVVLCADYHVGYGVPIGSVFAAEGYVLIYGIGNDIGCGVAVCETAYNVNMLSEDKLKQIFDTIQQHVPMGNGAIHLDPQEWPGLTYFDKEPHVAEWLSENKRTWIARSLGTLGSGK